MRNADGYSIITEPGKRSREMDVFKCAHCGRVNFTEGPDGRLQVLIFRDDGTHYMRDVARCRKCYHYICPRKTCTDECKNWEAKMDEDERLARFECTT